MFNIFAGQMSHQSFDLWTSPANRLSSLCFVSFCKTNYHVSHISWSVMSDVFPKNISNLHSSCDILNDLSTDSMQTCWIIWPRSQRAYASFARMMGHAYVIRKLRWWSNAFNWPSKTRARTSFLENIMPSHTDCCSTGGMLLKCGTILLWTSISTWHLHN